MSTPSTDAAPRALYESGVAAGLAGHLRPAGPGLVVQGWEHGNARRRIQAGEALGCSGLATLCENCGETHWGIRVACRCTRAHQDKRLQHGVLITDAQTGIAQPKFWTVRQALASGKRLIDPLTGKDVRLEPASAEARQAIDQAQN